MHEELLTASTCKRNFSQDQHARDVSNDHYARGTFHSINMLEELVIESTY